MTTKDKLKYIRSLKNELTEQRVRLADYTSIAEGIGNTTYSDLNSSHSGNSDKMADAVIKYVESPSYLKLKDEIIEKTSEYFESILEMENVIDVLNPICRRVIRMCYFDGLTEIEVAHIIPCCRRSVSRYKEEAFRILGEGGEDEN